MASLRRDALVLVSALFAAESAVGLAACSSSETTDAPEGEAGVEAGTEVDAQKDAPAPRPDSGKVGNCTVVKGACDLVVQDCPTDAKGKAQECVVTGAGAAAKTECIAVQSSQQLPQGHACCPSSAGNPCLPGLTCVGSACVDGGPQTGRCTPACCKGDDPSCGKSDPEGISGACDIILYSGDTEVHQVCSYRERCKPFNVEKCRSGDGCIVEDKLGTSSCVSSQGKLLGQPCGFANDCDDGLMCIGGGDAGVCRMMCLTPGAVHPFDAGVEEGGAGAGGCPSATCNGQPCCAIGVTDLPAWLSFCRFPDGG
jgi:hypothetical protein